MVKKILLYSVIAISLIAIGGYIYGAGIVYSNGIKSEVCNKITITITDSLTNRFLTKEDINSIILENIGEVKGKKRELINVNNIEKLLNQRSAIKSSQVYLYRNGDLGIEITQRRPIARIQTANGGFYIDNSKYIFPLAKHFTSYVPIVNGYIPLEIDENFRGNLYNESLWLNKLVDFVNYITKSDFWSSQIDQIYVNKEGEIELVPLIGEHVIIFGDLDNIESKFNRLLSFYKNVLPVEGWDKYSQINLKYKNQIVCKLK